MCVFQNYDVILFLLGGPGEEGGELTAINFDDRVSRMRCSRMPECCQESFQLSKEVVVCPGPSDSQCLKQIFPQQSTSTPGSRVAAGSWECALRWQHLLTTTVWLLVAPPRRSGRQQTWKSMISIWKSHHLELNNLNQFKLERLPTVNWKEGLYLYSTLGVTLRWLVNLVSSPGISQSGADQEQAHLERVPTSQLLERTLHSRWRWCGWPCPMHPQKPCAHVRNCVGFG